ncbi:MAG: M43 family zinc metalloprotease [Bacteroidota bacterium]|nr:M43 family zinc metalloprotease [Bacteroidota bacterium]
MKKTLLAFIKTLFIGVAIICFTNFTSIAQRTCGTMEHLEMQMEQDRGLELRMQQLEQEISNIQQNITGSRAVVTIPVVFHVVYRTNAENIPDYRLIDQLNVLTEDFRRLNADQTNTPAGFQGISADTEVEFCLAQRDPSGNATTGITRTLTSVTSFNTNDAVKYNSQGGKDIWDRNKYLNIWVCNLGGSLLGYAQFPGGTAATDGVVSHYLYTGTTGASAPYNKGRTGTHEVGHWLNLRHIWGDSNCGNDQVTDTPVQQSSNYSCPTYPRNPNTCSSTNANGDMFMNYMDYTDDGCMNAFTAGQGTRMQAALNTVSRVGLKTSNGCVPVNLQTDDAGISAIISPTGSSCNNSVTPIITLKNFGSTALTSVVINYNIDGGANQTYSWTGNLASQATVNVTLANITGSSGAHTFTSYTTMPNGVNDMLSSNDSKTENFTIIAAPTTVALPYIEGFEGTTFAPSGWQAINPDANVTWARSTQAGGFGNSASSARMDNFSGNVDISDQNDYLYTPYFNLSNAVAPVKIDFSVAYARYSASNHDSLIVSISTDCGGTWTRHYAKGNTILATNGGTNVQTLFLPTATQWRAESINLDTYIGNPNVRIAFQNKSGWGNALFIDDIIVSDTPIISTNVEKHLSSNITVYPNPSKGEVFIKVSSENEVKISIYNALGKVIVNENNTNNKSGNFNIDLSSYPNGVYFINIETSKGVMVKKMVLAK